MGKTFGDYMREQGGKEPEKEAVPTDECVIQSEGDKLVADVIEALDTIEKLIHSDPHHLDQLRYERWEEEMDRTNGWEGILGEEAEYALCENCHVSVPVDSGVTCEGCGVFFADHGKGRNNCWKNHNCGKLVTSRGQLVKEGDVLVYPSHSDEFTVMKMEGTWVKGGHARGLRRRGSHEMPILPRLMFHKETPTE